MIKMYINNKKQTKKKLPRKNMYVSIKQHSYLYSELVPFIRDVACQKLQSYRENISDKKSSVEHTSLLVATYLYN